MPAMLTLPMRVRTASWYPRGRFALAQGLLALVLVMVPILTRQALTPGRCAYGAVFVVIVLCATAATRRALAATLQRDGLASWSHAARRVVVIASCATAADGVARLALWPPPAAERPTAVTAAASAGSWLFVLVLWAAFYVASRTVTLTTRLARDRAALDRLGREAALQAHRAQMQPHFLFNALQAAMALAMVDPVAGHALLGRLGELLRAVVRLGERDLVALEEELRMCEAYLDVQRMRFGDRLRWTVQLADDCRATPVPPLAVQTLVDNAVRHGVERRVDGGTIALVVARVGSDVVVVVSNPRPAWHGPGDGSGVGLANVVRRLALLFGDRARLELLDEGRGPVTARLRLPGAPDARTDAAPRRATAG